MNTIINSALFSVIDSAIVNNKNQDVQGMKQAFNAFCSAVAALTDASCDFSTSYRALHTARIELQTLRNSTNALSCEAGEKYGYCN